MLNQTVIVGRLVKDPELRETESGKKVTNITLAVPRSYKNVNGEYRYFTKGDANKEIDPGYVTKKDIVGVTKFKIKYLGYPTLWVQDIFSE